MNHKLDDINVEFASDPNASFGVMIDNQDNVSGYSLDNSRNDLKRVIPQAHTPNDKITNRRR